MLRKHTMSVGSFQCNCSILVCEKTKEALVIDAGDEFPRIQKKCEELGIQLKYSIHTHAHLDHIGAVGPLKKWSPQTQIVLHKDDEWIYQQLPMQGQMFGQHYDSPPPVDRFANDEEVFTIGEASFKMVHTPGHSPGGICLHFKEGFLSEAPEVFTGDTLFQASVGRSDLWGGDHRLLIKSIKQRLLTMDEETQVHPGHGPSTVIGIETRENPFL